MEYLDGKDMQNYLTVQGRPYDVSKIREIGSQIINVISYLHENSIVHQDIKPANIVFSGDYQTIKLIDLGISNMIKENRHTFSA